MTIPFRSKFSPAAWALSAFVGIAFLFTTGSTFAQVSSPAAAPSPTPVEGMMAGEDSGAAYTYDPAGRRDPFKSLLATGGPKSGQKEGLPGVLIEELQLQGIWRVKSGLIAQMLGPAGKTYLVRKGDQLADGEVLNITTNEIVFRQNVNDPTMLKPFREVVRELNPTNPK
jgi:type IV pilus assembly protein PilP